MSVCARPLFPLNGGSGRLVRVEDATDAAGRFAGIVKVANYYR